MRIREIKRHATGCPACGADVRLTQHNKWPKHNRPPHGTHPCAIGGFTKGESEAYFRTFRNSVSYASGFGYGHQTSCEFQDAGDAIVIEAVAQVTTPTGTTELARVPVRIDAGEVPRVLSEIQGIAWKHSWLQRTPKPSRNAHLRRAAEAIARAQHDSTSNGPALTNAEWVDIWEGYSKAARHRYREMAEAAFAGLPGKWWADA